MALKFTLKTERIEFSDSDYIEVRGLNVPDITQLVAVHGQAISGLFDKFTGRDPDSLSIEDTAEVLPALVASFPAIATHVIALAADEEDQIEVVAKLPLDVQVSAIEKIANLTFAMQGGIKNFAETVLRVARGANGLVKEVKKPLT